MEIQITIYNATDRKEISARKGQAIGEIFKIPTNNKVYERSQGEWIEKNSSLILIKSTEIYI